MRRRNETEDTEINLDFLIHGAAKGLEWMARIIKAEGQAIYEQNDAKAHAARVVMEKWASEIEGVIANPLSALSDPFVGSRRMAEDFFKQYPK